MPTAACVRVSTADQNLDRQLEATHEYAAEELGVDPCSIGVYRDKSTGTNVEWSGYCRDGLKRLAQALATTEIAAAI